MFLPYMFLNMAMTIRAQMDGYIVGGELADILKNSYMSALSISECYRDSISAWRCGATILNQKILLSAGHCIYKCTEDSKIVANFGNEDRDEGVVRHGRTYVIHKSFDFKSFHYDMALVLLSKPLKLSDRISRVALMRNPPYSEPAKLAGWGQIDEEKKIPGKMLKVIYQKLRRHRECQELFNGRMPPGTICANSNKRGNYAASGDSGSGLIARGYIQLGIVSFKNPAISPNVLIYTDVGFYYDWIQNNTQKLYCSTA